MRKTLIFSVLVVTTLSSFTKKQMAINYSQNQLKEEIMLDTTKWWLTKIYTSDSFIQVSGSRWKDQRKW